MAPGGEVYRRLPGRRRGVTGGSSLWMGSDHILLVKSSWFREEYKRFYLRDIQAIVVARGARFYVSLPMLIFAFFWLLPAFGIPFWPLSVELAWGVGTVLLAAAWIALSMAASCRCRLYTAVSRDDLPSLYRTWTARRFLSRVKPVIDQVQGAIDPGWLEAEGAKAGPAPTAAADTAIPAPAGVAGLSRTLGSDLFVLSLLVGAFADLSVAHFNSGGWLRLRSLITLLQLAGAITVVIQRYRGTLQAPMQRVAIATLALIGVMFYVQTLAMSFIGAVSPGTLADRFSAMPPPMIAIHQVAGGLRLLLALIGLVIIVRGGRDQMDIIRN